MTNLRAGEHDNIVADVGMRDGNIRTNYAFAPDHHARTDYGIWANICAFADLDLRTDHRARRNLRTFSNRCSAADWLIVPSQRLVLRVKNSGKSSESSRRLRDRQHD